MKRCDDWPERLAAFVEQRRREPFAWGSRDCVAAANDWVEVCTGQRVFDAQHSDEATAAAAIEARGGLRAAVSAVLGEPIAEPLKVQRGDVLLFTSDAGPALGVCIGADFVAQAARGLRAYPIAVEVNGRPVAAFDCAWRVGDA